MESLAREGVQVAVLGWCILRLTMVCCNARYLPNPQFMDDFFDNWTVQVRKGVLELCLLSALDAGEHYGYALVKRLSATPGLSVAEGSIYPLLSRMKSAGLVDSRLEESSSGPARKYYQLTEAGRDRLRLMRPYFNALVVAVSALQPET